MPSYLNSGTRANSSGATSRTPALPGSRVSGNILIAVIGSKNNVDHTSTSPGWSRITQRNSGSGWTVSLWGYNRTSGGVDGSEAAPTVAVALSNVACFGQVHQVSGPCHPDDFIGATNENDGTSSTHSCTGFTSEGANSLAMYIDAAAANTALATPSGWTENVDNGSSTGATRNAAGSKALGGAGSSSGDISVAGASAAWVMIQLELLAAPPHAWEKGRYETDASQDDYTFPSWSPGAGTGKLVKVSWFGTVTTMPTLSGNGLTWTQIAALEASDYGVALFYASAGTPSAGVLTVNFGGTNPSRSCGVIIETPDAFTVVQSKTASTGGAGSLTVTLDDAPATGNWTFGVFNGKWPHTVGSGFTSLAQPGIGTNFDQIRTLFEYKESEDQTIESSFDFSAAVGIGVELEMASGTPHTKDLSDPLALTDTKAAATGKLGSEQLALSDARTLDASALRSELLSLADAAGKGAGRTFAEQLALEDDLATLLGTFLSQTLNEALALADTAGKVPGLRLLEVFVLTDILQRGTGKNVLDNLVLNDVRTAALVRELQEMLRAGDARLALLARTHVESIAFTDQRAAGFARSLAEVLAVADTLAKGGGKNVAEQLNLSDNLRRGVAAVFAELLALADGLAKTQSRALGETLALSDVVAGVLNADGEAHVKTLTDSLALVDSMTRAAAMLRADVLACADALAKSPALTLTEAAALAEFLIKSPALARAEQLIVADTVAKLYGLNETETLALNDLLAKQGAITVEELMELADSLSTQFVQVFGIVRFLAVLLRSSRIEAVLIEAPVLDLLNVRSAALGVVRVTPQPALTAPALGQSLLTKVVVISSS